jgi:hypothetical protein
VKRIKKAAGSRRMQGVPRAESDFDRSSEAKALKNPFRMIRIAISPAACEAIVATLPPGAAPWPVERQGDKCFIHTSRRLSSTGWGPCAGRERTI